MNIDENDIRNIISSSASRFQLWTRILRAINAEVMVEVGVWRGGFAKPILENCEFIRRYYMIDPWAPLPNWNKPLNVDAQTFEAAYAETLEKTAFAAKKIVVLRGRTKEVIEEIPDSSLDFAYIDGDHTLRGITIDLIKLIPKIKKNGFIGGDDFTPDPWQHDVRFEPTLVCPFSIYFAEAMDFPIAALPFSQYLIQKREGGTFSFTDYTGHYGDISLNKLYRPGANTK